MKCLWMLLAAAALVAVVHASPHNMEALARVARAADCDCDYHSGGCSIKTAAPKDFKCVCVYKGFYTCSGWAKGCRDGENCPGGKLDKAACRLGGGDCGAYKKND